MDYKCEYIPYNLVQKVLIALSIASIGALTLMNYDTEYRWIILLPITYALSFRFCVKKYMLRGIGAVALVGMYAFRMNILPILCAYGNFYIEPNKSIYIEYFGIAIILMCVECFIVFISISFYSRKYSCRKGTIIVNSNAMKKERLINQFVIVALISYGIIVVVHTDILTSHYHFLISTVEDATNFDNGNTALQNYGAIYYLSIILDVVARPIASFVLVNWALKKNTRIGLSIATLVGILNIVWISDRRILSLLIGACCLVQVLPHMRSKLTKHTLYWMIGILALMTIVYCFMGEDTPIRVARKFQRYFSGPSLTAIGIAVYNNYIQTPIEFLKLLFNDSVILTGLFDAFLTRGYVIELCGPAGYSIWTPMFIGAIQYFHVFAPMLIVGVVKFLVYTDYKSQSSNTDLKKMMYNYISVATSVYMVMYSLELVYYNIIFIGGFFYLLISASNRIEFCLSVNRKNS